MSAIVLVAEGGGWRVASPAARRTDVPLTIRRRHRRRNCKRNACESISSPRFITLSLLLNLLPFCFTYTALTFQFYLYYNPTINFILQYFCKGGNGTYTLIWCCFKFRLKWSVRKPAKRKSDSRWKNHICCVGILFRYLFFFFYFNYLFLKRISN